MQATLRLPLSPGSARTAGSGPASLTGAAAPAHGAGRCAARRLRHPDRRQLPGRQRGRHGHTADTHLRQRRLDRHRQQHAGRLEAGQGHLPQQRQHRDFGCLDLAGRIDHRLRHHPCRGVGRPGRRKRARSFGWPHPGAERQHPHWIRQLPEPQCAQDPKRCTPGQRRLMARSNRLQHRGQQLKCAVGSRQLRQRRQLHQANNDRHHL